jgi:hypothetical protein
METGNLDLLLKDKSKKVRHHSLEDIWSDLLDYYYSATNIRTWSKFKYDLKSKLTIESQMLTINACLKLIEYGNEKALTILKDMNVDTSSIKSIYSALNRKKTKLEILNARNDDRQKKEAINFSKILARIQIQLPYQVNPDQISLEAWVGMLQVLQEKNKAQKEALNNKKGRRK